MSGRRDEDIQDQIGKLNKSDCIKKPDNSDAIIIYSCIPLQYYNDVLAHGLKSYDLITQESKQDNQRYHALPGHNQCVFFRPSFLVSDDQLKTDAYIGVKADPNKVRIANQEIRTIISGNVYNMYLGSAISYDLFRLDWEKYSKELPKKFPYSDTSGHLVWLMYEDGNRKNYVPYIPEIAINISKPIAPDMFAFFNKQLSQSERKQQLSAATSSTFFSAAKVHGLNKVTIEDVRDKLSSKIPGLKNILSDPLGNIRLIFEDHIAVDNQLKAWSKIDGISKPPYPDNCIEINKECPAEIVDKMLQIIMPGLTGRFE